MTIKLTVTRMIKLREIVNQMLTIKNPTIRFLAKAIGIFVSSFPAVKFGPLHYRNLEKEKTIALKQNKGNFEATLELSLLAKSELLWWKENHSNENWICPPKIDFEMYCDASNFAWGAVFYNESTGGAWSDSEKSLHINMQELLAIYYSLRSFSKYIIGKHIKVFSDNTSAVAIINKMGTCRSQGCDSNMQINLDLLQQIQYLVNYSSHSRSRKHRSRLSL